MCEKSGRKVLQKLIDYTEKEAFEAQEETGRLLKEFAAHAASLAEEWAAGGFSYDTSMDLVKKASKVEESYSATMWLWTKQQDLLQALHCLDEEVARVKSPRFFTNEAILKAIANACCYRGDYTAFNKRQRTLFEAEILRRTRSVLEDESLMEGSNDPLNDAVVTALAFYDMDNE